MEYLLGTSDEELERLRFQHELWGPVTGAFLERAGLAAGQRVLDLGCGPGFLLEDLAAKVGPGGCLVGVDPSPRWEALLRERFGADPRVELVRGSVEQLELEPASFDLIVCRWVFCFLPDPAGAVGRLARALAPGGVLAIQDYNHEGISLFPASPGFEAAVRATRTWFAESGGDTWIGPKLPRHLRAAGLEVLPLNSTVLSGGPDSAVFRWADLFFGHFADLYRDQGRLGEEEHAAFRREWAERAGDPDAVFCSPILMDVAGRRPL